jgi:hypothetical protein
MAKKKRQKLFKKIKRVVDMKAQHLRIAGKDKDYGKSTAIPTQVPITAVQSHRES